MIKWILLAAAGLPVMVFIPPWILFVLGLVICCVLLVDGYYTFALPSPYLGLADISTIRINWIVPQTYRTLLEIIPEEGDSILIDPVMSPHTITVNEFTGKYAVISTRVQGLTPNKKYHYIVWRIKNITETGNGPVVRFENCKKRKLFGGESFYFVAPDANFMSRPLKVAVLGDLQPRDGIPPLFQWWVLKQIHRENVDLLFFLGDHTTNMALPRIWRWYFHIIGKVARNRFVFGVPGNHDLTLKRNGRRVFSNDAYTTYVNYPDQKLYYGIHVYGVHLVALNYFAPCTLESEQGQFVNRQLSEHNPEEWLIPLWHTSPYNSLSPGDHVNEMRTEIEPLLRKTGVKVWFGGHEHAYQRYTVNGVEFVTTAATSSFHCHRSNCEHQTRLVMKIHHCLCEISPSALHLQAIDFSGKIIDEFTIQSSRIFFNTRLGKWREGKPEAYGRVGIRASV